MERAITGSITSTQLGNLGKRQYGFIDIKTEEKEELKIKVAAFTKYDTLDIGRRVHIVAETVGAIMTAKTISIAE
jgi:hypothetical protein